VFLSEYEEVFSAALLSALLACVALVAQVQSGWKEYVYAEDGFAVSAPRNPRLSPHPRKPDWDRWMRTNYAVDLGNDNKVGIFTAQDRDPGPGSI